MKHNQNISFDKFNSKNIARHCVSLHNLVEKLMVASLTGERIFLVLLLAEQKKNDPASAATFARPA